MNPLNLAASNIETIDAAFLQYVEDLKIHCTTINGWEKIPVIWSSAERAYQIKNNKELRDRNGSLIPPIISIERSSTSKNTAEKGGFWGTLSPKDDRYIITRELNQDKTANFANADSLRTKGQLNFVTSKKNQKKVYEYVSIPTPIYITVQYKINILTNYQSQMNEALQPFMARTAQNYFLISKEEHRYECFMEANFDQEAINLGEEERKYKSTVSVKVLGYLIGEGVNQEKAQQIKKENAVEIKLPKENISIVQEIPKQKEAPSLLRNSGAPVLSTVAIKKTFTIGDPDFNVYNINHNLNTRDMYVSVRENFNTFDTVQVAISFEDLNNISLDIGDPPAPGQQYVVTIIG